MRNLSPPSFQCRLFFYPNPNIFLKLNHLNKAYFYFYPKPSPHMQLRKKLLFLFFLPAFLPAQNNELPMLEIPLQNMSAFKPVAANWQIVGDATADLNKDEILKPLPGAGVLLNVPDAKNRDNIVSILEHGDIDLDLDFMMARHSNSGIYLQGRYEVQLFDSWGNLHPSFSDCGGIYERWNDDLPEGKKGYQGYAPRVNVARAPGLWQHLHISFLAPRFDAGGKKIANAKILQIQLNGVTIHENIELTGPTRGPAFAAEGPKGPLLIQGDHGPVAFRNFRYRAYDRDAPALKNIQYQYYSGDFAHIPAFETLKADERGSSENLTWKVSPTPNDFALRITGVLKNATAGKYNFELTTYGEGMMKVNQQTLLAPGYWQRQASIELPAGDIPIEIAYAKKDEWLSGNLQLVIEGPGFRRTPLHSLNSQPLDNPTNPILVDVSGDPVLLRSFMDIGAGDSKRRIVHNISVGQPGDCHYSFDLDRGALFQTWRGGFLDATPMWDDRGDGSSVPLGSILSLSDAPDLAALANETAPWPDSVSPAASFRSFGYDLDDAGYPTFRYTLYGLDISDVILPQEGGKKLSREVSLSGNNVAGLQFRLAEGSRIDDLGNGLYAIDNKRYYLQWNGPGNPAIRTINQRQELLLPVTGASKWKYSLIW